MRDRILHLLADLVWRRPLVILAIAVVLAIISGLYASKSLVLNANTDDLIAPNRPFMIEYRRFMEEFGDLDFIYAVVENAGDQARTEAAVDRLTERVRAIPGLPAVYSAVEPDEQLRIASRAMSESELAGLSLSSGAFPAITSGDTARVLREATDMLRRLIQFGASLNQQQQERLGAAAVFLLNAIAAAKPDSPSQRELAFLLGENQKREYFKSDTGRFYFIIISPEKNFHTLSVIEEPLRRIRQAIADVRQEFPDVPVGLTGKPVLQADEMATTDADMTRASLIAVCLCSILFMVAFGSVIRPLLAVVAFACAAAWTYGLTALTIGQLNLLSIVFILILIGVGLDYGIHVISRYREHRAVSDVRSSVAGAMLTAGRGNITGSLASATVFFMALFTSFQGLRELGVIAGSGLLLCMFAMTVILPTLLTLVYRWRADANEPKPDEAPASMETSAGVLRWILARPLTVLAIAAMLTLALAFAPFRLRFDYNLLNLQSTHLESVQWERRMAADSASNSWFGTVVADTLEEVKAITDRAKQKPSIGAVHSVLDVVQVPTPQREQYRQRLHDPTLPATPSPDTPPTEGTPPPGTASKQWSEKDLQAITGALDLIALGAASQAPDEAKRLRQISADLKSLANEMARSERGAGQGQSSARDRIEQAVQRIGQSLSTILAGDQMDLYNALPAGVRRQFMSPPPRSRFVVLLHPREDVWDYEPMRRFIEDMRAVDPSVTGMPITQFESLHDMTNAFSIMSVLAVIVITGIVSIDFRKLRDIILALLPMIVGAVWTAEWMGLMNITFNMANFFSVPILIGLSVNGSVYVLHRYREGGPTRFTLGATRRAVIVTTLNTMIGFGCLVFARHHGLRSLGEVMVIGTASYLLGTLIVLPAILSLIEARKQPE